ncbi:MAG: type II secretion system minor pseudopilin GspK [bacterium]
MSAERTPRRRRRVAPPRLRRPGSSQRGVALLLVLLIIAVVASIQIETQYLTRIDAKIASNVALDTRFYYLAKSGVEAARSLLTEDARDNEFDATSETWAAPIAYPVDEALVSLSIVDEERKFPLNYLLKRTTPPPQNGQPQPPQYEVDAPLYEAFTRLLEAVEAPPEVAPALIDWLDPDDDPYGPDGAEINFYERLKPPYRTKNRALSTLDELRLVRGIDAKVFRAIADLVTPYSSDAKVNVNTAPRELLAVLMPEADASALDEIVQKRTDEPFQKIQGTEDNALEAFLSGFSWMTPDRLKEVLELFRASSSHFTISSTASLIPSSDDGDTPTQPENLKLLRAVVNRNGDGVTELVYWRAT